MIFSFPLNALLRNMKMKQRGIQNHCDSKNQGYRGVSTRVVTGNATGFRSGKCLVASARQSQRLFLAEFNGTVSSGNTQSQPYSLIIQGVPSLKIFNFIGFRCRQMKKNQDTRKQMYLKKNRNAEIKNIKNMMKSDYQKNFLVLDRRQAKKKIK